MTIGRIARMTDRQIAEIYGQAPREARKEDDGGGQSYREIFWAIWQKRGWAEEDIQARWDREQASADAE